MLQTLWMYCRSVNIILFILRVGMPTPRNPRNLQKCAVLIARSRNRPSGRCSNDVHSFVAHPLNFIASENIDFLFFVRSIFSMHAFIAKTIKCDWIVKRARARKREFHARLIQFKIIQRDIKFCMAHTLLSWWCSCSFHSAYICAWRRCV